MRMARGDWPQVALGEILTERTEVPDLASLESGTIPIISKIRFADGEIEFRGEAATKTKMILIRPGDLVLSGINAMKGAIAIYEPETPTPAAATIHYSTYQVDSSRADIRYLWWLLRSAFFRDVLQQQVPQGIKTELKAARLLPVVIHLPFLPEQQRIVARIEAVMNKVAEATVLQHKARQEADKLMLSAITKVLSPYQKRTTIKSCLKEPLRNGLSLSAGDIVTGDSLEGKGIPFLKLGAVSFQRFDPSQVKLVNIELPDDSPFWVQPGDLLMGRGNSLELVGRAALYTGQPMQFAYPDLIIRIRLDAAKVIPEFVAWFLRSREAREFIERRVVGTSPTMKKVSQPLVEQIPVPEVGIAEQRRVVDLLNRIQLQVDEIVQAQESTQTELAALLPAVLDKAFRGEL